MSARDMEIKEERIGWRSKVAGILERNDSVERVPLNRVKHLRKKVEQETFSPLLHKEAEHERVGGDD